MALVSAQDVEYNEVKAVLKNGTRVHLYNLDVLEAAIAKSVDGRWYAGAAATRLQTLRVRPKEDEKAVTLAMSDSGDSQAVTLVRLDYIEIDLIVSNRDSATGVYYIDVDFISISYSYVRGVDPKTYTEQLRYIFSRWLIIATKNSAVFAFKDAQLTCNSRYVKGGVVQVETCPLITATRAARETTLDALDVEWSE